MHASVTTVFRSATSAGSISSASARPASAWRISGTFSARAGSENSTLASGVHRRSDTPALARLIALPAPSEQPAQPPGPDVGAETAGAALGRRQRRDLVRRRSSASPRARRCARPRARRRSAVPAPRSRSRSRRGCARGSCRPPGGPRPTLVPSRRRPAFRAGPPCSGSLAVVDHGQEHRLTAWPGTPVRRCRASSGSRRAPRSPSRRPAGVRHGARRAPRRGDGQAPRRRRRSTSSSPSSSAGPSSSGAWPALARAIYPDGGLWIAWPKRSSGVATDLTEDVVRELALAARAGRQQGLRDRRDLVGPAARLAARDRASAAS